MLYTLEEVCLSYKLGNRRISILTNIDMTVSSNEFLVIMGPSGSGKTSILNLMAGFLKPSSGRVLYNDNDLSSMSSADMSKYRNREIGIVHQFFNLISSFNAIQNVAAPLFIDGIAKKEAHERSEIVLERVGMLGRSRHFPHELSGGEQQRIAIARALINQPRVILADEPTGNLDYSNTMEILDMFSEIHTKGTAIVMVTHDPAVSERATKVVTLDKSMCRV